MLKDHNNVDILDQLNNASAQGNLSMIKKLLNKYCYTRDELNNAFLRACEGNQLNVIKFLNEKGIDINYKNEDNDFGLLIAAEKGYLNIVKYLLWCGCDVDLEGNDEYTAIQASAGYNHYEVTKCLLEHGVDLRSKNYALELAASWGYLNIIRLLCDSDAFINFQDENGDTPLMSACYFGYIDVIKYFIISYLYKIIPDKKNNHGNTAIINACYRGHYKIVKYLIDSGCNPCIKNNAGKTALHVASEGKSIKLLKLLVKYISVSEKDSGGNTPLITACRKNNFDVVKFLLSKGADTNHANNEGNTPLMFASGSGDLQLIKYLVGNKAKIDVQNNYGYTALILSIINDQYEIFRYLIDCGANINLCDKGGATVLTYACAKRNKKIIDLLLDKNIYVQPNDLQIVYKNGCEEISKELINCVSVQDILISSVTKGNLELVKLLFERSSEIRINKVFGDGMTLLFLATAHEHYKICKYLIKKGADVNYSDYSGKTALLYAAALRNVKLVSLFLKNGCNVNKPCSKGYTALKVAVGWGDLQMAQLLIDYQLHGPVQRGQYGPSSLSKYDGLTLVSLIYEIPNVSNEMRQLLMFNHLIRVDQKLAYEKHPYQFIKFMCQWKIYLENINIPSYRVYLSIICDYLVLNIQRNKNKIKRQIKKYLNEHLNKINQLDYSKFKDIDPVSREEFTEFSPVEVFQYGDPIQGKYRGITFDYISQMISQGPVIDPIDRSDLLSKQSVNTSTTIEKDFILRSMMN